MSKEIKNYVFRLLARREYSRQELSQKLRLKKFDNGNIKTVLDEIEANNWQSDERFAQNLINARIRQGYGPLRIQLELKQKGVNEELIKQALSPYSEQWPSLIKQVYFKKFANLDSRGLNQKAKEIRFLQYRGFSLEQINALYAEISKF